MNEAMRELYDLIGIEYVAMELSDEAYELFLDMKDLYMKGENK